MQTQVIPLQAIPAQTVSVALNNQSCQINVYTLGNAPYENLFVDLYVNNALIIGGVIAQNLNLIVRDAYLGFVGDIAFNDTMGTNDPDYTGLGSRYVLLYIFPAVNGVPT